MEKRIYCYDTALLVEAYYFKRICQSFPEHFHEHYVIGLLEGGKRIAKCRQKTYEMKKGDFFLLNPRENHSCASCEGSLLEYASIHISEKVMEQYINEMTPNKRLPYFETTVCCDEELRFYFQRLHKMILQKEDSLQKEACFYIFLSLALQKYSRSIPKLPETSYCEQIQQVCQWIEEHYQSTVTLEQLCNFAFLSKSTLLRAFTKQKGITPYRYLETIRINEAKKLLQQGMTPAQSALQTGFSDQSHFHRFFTAFIGVPPGVYRAIWQKQGVNENESK